MGKTLYFKKTLTPVYLHNLGGETNIQITDASLPGFQFRYYALTKAKVFYLYYRVKGTYQQRNMKLGTMTEFSLTEARLLAIQLKKEIRMGHDPQIDRRERGKQTAREEALRKKIKDLVPEFLEKHCLINNRKTTYMTNAGYFKNHIVPMLGNVQICDVDLRVAQDMYDKIRMDGTPSLADHNIRLLSSFLSWCEKFNYRPINSNPCHHVQKVRMPKFKPKLLDKNGYTKILEALDEALQIGNYGAQPILALKALILTGCRCSEITDLEHSELDLEHGYLRLNKRKTDFFDVPLSEPAMDVIRQAVAICKSDRYVFHSPINHLKPLSDLRKAFWWALERAGLPKMRVHDLRHSFATMATSIGEDIRTIKDVLGHTTITTTEIYAHTTNSAARKTANNVAAAILGNDKPAPAPDTTPPTAPAVAPVAIPVANIGIGNIPANDHAGPYTLRVLPEAARA